MKIAVFGTGYVGLVSGALWWILLSKRLKLSYEQFIQIKNKN